MISGSQKDKRGVEQIENEGAAPTRVQVSSRKDVQAKMGDSWFEVVEVEVCAGCDPLGSSIRITVGHVILVSYGDFQGESKTCARNEGE